MARSSGGIAPPPAIRRMPKAPLRDEPLIKLVQAATRSAWRGAQLTQQMLAFSRRQVLSAKATDLNAAVSGMSEMLRRTLGEHGVEVRTVLAPELWPALVHRTQIEVAVLNLAINAPDAMSVGGRVVIATRNVSAGERDFPSELRPGDYVVVSVADNGEGMAPETLAKASDPFFTTKEVGKGTGLGLSQVYGLAQQSGGTARIHSRLGEGTTTEIYLPRAAALSAETSADAEVWSPEPRHRTVVVADDQDDVREVLVAHLEALGYRCVQLRRGRSPSICCGAAVSISCSLITRCGAQRDRRNPGRTGRQAELGCRAHNWLCRG